MIFGTVDAPLNRTSFKRSSFARVSSGMLMFRPPARANASRVILHRK